MKQIIEYRASACVRSECEFRHRWSFETKIDFLSSFRVSFIWYNLFISNEIFIFIYHALAFSE